MKIIKMYRKQNITLKRQKSDKEKKDKNANETLEIIEKIIDYNKDAQNTFYRASKVDKKKIKTKG